MSKYLKRRKRPTFFNWFYISLECGAVCRSVGEHKLFHVFLDLSLQNKNKTIQYSKKISGLSREKCYRPIQRKLFDIVPGNFILQEGNFKCKMVVTWLQDDW